MKIVICGSLSFAKEMIKIKNELEKIGQEVVIPTNAENYAKGTIDVENKLEKIQLNVIKTYYGKIKNSDGVLIINKDKNNIKNYIGGNGLIEMAFAHVLNKKIFLLNEIPKMSYSDEIEAMKPIILNNNLNLIK